MRAGGRGSLAGAVWFYTRRSFVNRARAQLRRLRSPRALVAVAAGAGYVYWFLVRPVRGGEFPADAGLGAAAARPLAALAALGLTALAAAWWLGRPAGGDGRGAAGPARALAFTPAEEHLLFPAPVTRRGLVRWKLWRAQAGILVNTLIWTVLLRGAGGEPAAWRRAAALWVLLSTVLLHRTGAALATGGLQARLGALADAAADSSPNGPPDGAPDGAPDDTPDGRPTGPRGVPNAPPRGAGRLRLLRLAPALLFAALAAALAGAALGEQARLAAAWDAGLGPFARALARALDQPAARLALLPARLAVDPLFAAPAGLTPWLRALGPALGLLALHYLWVLRTDAAVQELGLAAGARWRALRRGRPPVDTSADDGPRNSAAGADAARPTASPRARRRAPALAPTGWPAGALVWKNLVAAGRAVALARLLALFAVTAAAVLVVAARTPRLAEVAGVVAGVWGAMLVVAGPSWVRFDLRHDLPHLPFLRAAPLAGRDVVAAEIAASTIALTALQIAAGALLLLASLGARDGFGLTGTERAVGAVVALLALPGVNAALLTVHNAAALLFPAWVRPPGTPRGVEAMGQNLVTTALTLAAAALVLAPAAAAGAAVWWGVRRATAGAAGPWAFAPAALVLTLAALLVLAPAVAWLGRVFDRTDPPTAEAA